MAARSRRLLGDVAAETDQPGAALDHWQAALETFADVGAPHDALAALQRLVDHVDATSVEDCDRVEEWVRRAADLLADAPDAVVEEHRDWTDERLAALDAE